MRKVDATDHSVQVPGLPGAVIRAPFQAHPGLVPRQFAGTAADERCHAAKPRSLVQALLTSYVGMPARVAGLASLTCAVMHQVMRRKPSTTSVAEEPTSAATRRQENPGFVAVEYTSICKTCRAKRKPTEKPKVTR